MVFVGSVLENALTKVKFPVLRKRVGKLNRIFLKKFDKEIRIKNMTKEKFQKQSQSVKSAKRSVSAASKSGAVNYPVGDFLIRIKNAVLARNRDVEVESNKLIKDVASVFKKEGFLEEAKEEKGKLKIRLSYRRKEPILLGLKLISSPGLRVYSKVDGLEKKRGASIYVLSTPKGIMSSKEAIKKRVGGEIIVEVW